MGIITLHNILTDKIYRWNLIESNQTRNYNVLQIYDPQLLNDIVELHRQLTNSNDGLPLAYQHLYNYGNDCNLIILVDLLLNKKCSAL